MRRLFDWLLNYFSCYGSTPEEIMFVLLMAFMFLFLMFYSAFIAIIYFVCVLGIILDNKTKTEFFEGLTFIDFIKKYSLLGSIFLGCIFIAILILILSASYILISVSFLNTNKFLLACAVFYMLLFGFIHFLFGPFLSLNDYE